MIWGFASEEDMPCWVEKIIVRIWTSDLFVPVPQCHNHCHRYCQFNLVTHRAGQDSSQTDIIPGKWNLLSGFGRIPSFIISDSKWGCKQQWRVASLVWWMDYWSGLPVRYSVWSGCWKGGQKGQNDYKDIKNKVTTKRVYTLFTWHLFIALTKLSQQTIEVLHNVQFVFTKDQSFKYESQHVFKMWPPPL